MRAIPNACGVGRTQGWLTVLGSNLRAGLTPASEVRTFQVAERAWLDLLAYDPRRREVTAGAVRGERPRPRATLWARAAAAIVAAALAAGCGGTAGGEGEVVVMAASSLAEVIEQVSTDGADIDGTDIVWVIAGTSTLLSQLAAGAGADVLITANAATMERAVSDGSIGGESMVIATNSLVLATPAGNPGSVTGLADLARRDLLVGLCAVEVPCGALARQALDAAAIVPAADTLEPNVRALATKLALGELDAGLVYSTDAAAGGLSTIGAPELEGHVNRYHIAPVPSEPSPAVRAVIDAFTEPGGAGVEALHAHGFGPP